MYASRRMRFQVHMQIDQKLLPELLRASSNYYISVPLWFEVRRPKEDDTQMCRFDYRKPSSCHQTLKLLRDLPSTITHMGIGDRRERNTNLLVLRCSGPSG